MKCAERLELEHRWISSMTDALEAILADAQATGLVHRTAYELLRLYEDFADGRHQDKEEEVLFPALLDAASDAERAQLGQLLDDHGAERRRLHGMRVNLLGGVHGDPGCVKEFLHEAHGYLALHRAHMQREHEYLLPMIEHLLTEETDAQVVAGFEKLEGGEGDPHGVAEQVRGILHSLGMPTPPAA